MASILKTKLVDHFFIEAFTTTTVERKVIILQVVPSRLLVVLNAKSIAELLMSYKGALARILKIKAWHQAFRQPLAQRPLQIMEGKSRYQRQVVGG